MRTYHTHFGIALGNTTPGWRGDRSINYEPGYVASLPSLKHSQQPQLRTFLPSPFLPQLSGSKECIMTGTEGLTSSGSVTNVTGTLFRMRNMHILLDCPHEHHLVSLRTQHRQLVFPPQHEDSPTRLRTFLNQPDIYGVASFVAECLLFSFNFF